MMNIDPKKRVTLSSPLFDKMRNDLDLYITKMLPLMQEKNSLAGKISLQIDFAILEDEVKCDNSPTGIREAKIPHIGYKLVLSMQSKAEKKDDVVGGKGHEVVQNGYDYYIVTKEEASGQLNMFNGYDELPNEDDGPDPDAEGDEE